MIKKIQKIEVNKPTLAIFDSDLLIFQAAWMYREQKSFAGILASKKKLDSIIAAVLEKVNCDYYIGFYGIPGTKNYRYEAATLRPYKGTREVRDPWIEYFKPILKPYMGEKWGFIGVGDIEADDAVSIAYNQLKDKYDITIVFEDKDLKQIAYSSNTTIKQYNPNKRDGGSKFSKITPHDGMKFFYQQCLQGEMSPLCI